MRLGDLLWVGLLAPAVALAGTELGRMRIQPDPEGAELALELTSSLVCPQQIGNAFPGVTGVIAYQGRSIRFEIFRYTGEAEVALGPAPSEATDLTITLDQDGGCIAPSIRASVARAEGSGQLGQLALEHSPFVIIRKDQKKNRFTDLPVGLAYSVIPGQNGAFSLKYTLYMTDEDSQGFLATGREQSMGQYGRRTDIEWLYQVDFDSQGRVRKRTYQGGVLFGIGHKKRAFRGHYLPGSQHPILYDIANHNVFKDKPERGQRKLGLLGHHLVARDEIQAPRDRTWWQFEHPWLFEASDRELASEHRLKAPSDDYLYVWVSGNLSHGRLGVRLRFFQDWTQEFWSGGGEGFLTELGDTLWGREGFTAVPLGHERLEEIARAGGRGQLGVLDLNDPFGDGTRLKLEGLRFFRLVRDSASFRVEELTDRFRCAFGDLHTECGL
jgi:hypothetical protein